jgi:hypothetical protein
MSNSSQALEKLIAEAQIRDVVARYARGVDRQDGDIISACFHPGALAHYGDFDGTSEEFVPWVLPYVAHYGSTMHFMGTTIIDWSEGTTDRAVSETYANVWHEIGSGKPGRSWVGGIRYIDRFERRCAPGSAEAIWRIAERSAVGDWLHINAAENQRRFPDVMQTGRADRDDPLFSYLSRLAD